MKPRKFIDTDVVDLQELTYEDVRQLEVWCRSTLNNFEGWRYKAMEQERFEEAQHAEERSLVEEKKQAEAMPKILKWLKDNVKPGTRLKMRGCRDGHGVREFIRWDNNDNLICFQMERNKMEMVQGKQITTHMPHKVSKVFVSKTKAVPVKELAGVVTWAPR